jgi:hypothetical protein
MSLLSAAGYLIVIATTVICYFLFKNGEWEFALGIIALAAYSLMRIMSRIAIARGTIEGRFTPRVALRVLTSFTLMCTVLCIVFFGTAYLAAKSAEEKSLYRRWCQKHGLYYYGFDRKRECRNSTTGEIVTPPDLNSMREQLR